MIKTIIFDFFGVVVNNLTGKSAQKISKELKVPVNKFNRAVRKHANGLDTGTKTEEEFIKKLVKELELDLPIAEVRKMFEKSDKENIKTRKKVLDLIKKLKNNYNVVLATNVSRELSGRLKKDGLYDIFAKNKRFFSYKIGYAKPDKKFFKYIFKNLNIKPEETLLIDDRRENILEAKKLRIKGISYKNVEQFKKELDKYLK